MDRKDRERERRISTRVSVNMSEMGWYEGRQRKRGGFARKNIRVKMNRRE